MDNINAAGGADLVLKHMKDYRLLTAEEEAELGRAVRHGGPRERDEAVEALVLHNLRYCVKMASKYAGSGMEREDLVQEGVLGLITAAKKYDPDLGYRFSTYATWWVRQSITRAIADKADTIRKPVHMNEKIIKYRQALRKMENLQVPSGERYWWLSEELGTGEDEVRLVETYAQKPASLNTSVSDDKETELGDMITDGADPVEEAAMRGITAEAVREAVDSLGKDGKSGCTVSERDREIIRLRYGLDGGEPLTLEETGKRFGITRERVRQIEKKLLRMLGRRPEIRGLAGDV